MGALSRNGLIVIKYQMFIYSSWEISVEILPLGASKSVYLRMIKRGVSTWYCSLPLYKKHKMAAVNKNSVIL